MHQQELDSHQQLFVDDPPFDLIDMLKDESEDEEEQVNREIDEYCAQPFGLETSNAYRSEINDSFYYSSSASAAEKKEKMMLIRDADFWMTKGISMTAHN